MEGGLRCETVGAVSDEMPDRVVLSAECVRSMTKVWVVEECMWREVLADGTHRLDGAI